MKTDNCLAAALAALALSGCVTSQPMTAQEFRDAVPGARFAEFETFEVDRPFGEVAAAFESRAPDCLSGTVKTTSQTNMSYQVIVSLYKPTVVVSDARAELHLQRHHEKGVLKVTKEPDGGYYLMVADAYPVDGGKSRLQIIGPSMGYDVIYRSILGWATGDNLGCPDLTKTG